MKKHNGEGENSTRREEGLRQLKTREITVRGLGHSGNEGTEPVGIFSSTPDMNSWMPVPQDAKGCQKMLRPALVVHQDWIYTQAPKPNEGLHRNHKEDLPDLSLPICYNSSNHPAECFVSNAMLSTQMSSCIPLTGMPK